MWKWPALSPPKGANVQKGQCANVQKGQCADEGVFTARRALTHHEMGFSVDSLWEMKWIFMNFSIGIYALQAKSADLFFLIEFGPKTDNFASCNVVLTLLTTLVFSKPKLYH